MADIPRIFIWCWPRTVSTAFGKCLSNVDGVQFWLEPYQNCFNNDIHKNAAAAVAEDQLHPGYVQYMTKLRQTMATSNANKFFSDSKSYPQDKFMYPWVKKKLEEDEPGKKFIIVKDLSMAIVNKVQYLPEVPTCRHLFLIRHPLRIAKSMEVAFLSSAKYLGLDNLDFDVARNTPFMRQGHFKRDDSHKLWRYLQENGANPAIIDSDDLCREPERMLPKTFKAVGIPYDEKYLTWDAGEEIVKSWKGSIGGIVTRRATKFYERAFQSSCFMPPKPEMPSLNDIPDLLRENHEVLLKCYQEMYAHRIRPDG